MRFRGKIEGLAFESTFSEMPHPIPDFTFSRKRIWFSEKHKDKYYTNPFLTYFIQHESDYTFSKDYDKKEKKRFIVTFAGGKDASYIKLNWLNRIKCNIVHKRYIFQRDPDWFWKTLIAAGIGAVFGFIGGSVGYKSGFRDGTKQTKEAIRDTIPK